MATILGCFLYYKSALEVEYFIQFTQVASFEYHEISRFSTILENEIFKISAVSRSVLTSLLFSIK